MPCYYCFVSHTREFHFARESLEGAGAEIIPGIGTAGTRTAWEIRFRPSGQKSINSSRGRDLCARRPALLDPLFMAQLYSLNERERVYGISGRGMLQLQSRGRGSHCPRLQELGKIGLQDGSVGNFHMEFCTEIPSCITLAINIQGCTCGHGLSFVENSLKYFAGRLVSGDCICPTAPVGTL